MSGIAHTMVMGVSACGVLGPLCDEVMAGRCWVVPALVWKLTPVESWHGHIKHRTDDRTFGTIFWMVCMHFFLYKDITCAHVQAFKALRDDPAKWSALSAAQQRIVETELRDFVLGGVALEVG